VLHNVGCFLQRHVIPPRRLIMVDRCAHVAALIEGIEDLWPHTHLPPALIPRVERLPGTKVRGDLPPGGTGPDHPEDASQDGAMIHGWSSGWRLLQHRASCVSPRP